MQNSQTATTNNEWTIHKLGDLCDIKTGKKDVNAESTDGKYPFFTCAQEAHKINTFTFDTEAVLVAGNGFFNVKYYNGKFDVYQRTYVLHNFKKDIYGKYIYHYVSSKLGEITKDNRGSTIRYIRLGDLTEQEVQLPNYVMQKEIVEKIESSFGKVKVSSNNISKAKLLIHKFRQSVLSSAITGKITEGWRLRNPSITAEDLYQELIANKKRKLNKYLDLIEEEDLPEIPPSWKYTRLDYLVKGFKYGTSEKSDYSYKGTPILRIPNVIYQEIDFTDIKYLSNDTDNENWLVKEGDILIVRSNGSRDLVGKNALVRKLDKPYAYASYLIKISPYRVSSDFVLLLLSTLLVRRQLFNQSKSAAGINNINTKELASIMVPLPPLDEQNKIVKSVESLFSTAKKVEQQIENAGNRVNKLSQSILFKAFKGELIN